MANTTPGEPHDDTDPGTLLQGFNPGGRSTGGTGYGEAESPVESVAVQTAIDTINAMGEGVAVLDLDGRIRDSNPAFAALTEYDRETLHGQFVWRLLPDVFDQDTRTVQRTFSNLQLRRPRLDEGNALSVTTGKGMKKWVVPTVSMIHGRDDEPVGVVLTLRDISTLVQAQEMARESEERYRELVENANSIIMRITPELEISFFNEYAQRFFGLAARDAAGARVVPTLFPEVDSEGRDMHRVMRELALQPELHGTHETESVCKDGRRVWVHWSNRAIRDDQGQVAEILCVGTDITERRRLQVQADAYRRRLRALADRLAASEEAERRRVSTHIHDTVIQTLSLANIRLGGLRRDVDRAGLTESCQDIDRVRKLLDEGITECRNLMADLTPPLLYELGLAAALKGFAEKQGALHQRKITVEVGDDDARLDEARRGLLFQSARELLMNALKHAGPCEIRLRLANTGGQVRLEVLDTGAGFDTEDADLYSPHNDGGFGLFNIRERLQGLGGTLAVSSKPGRGTSAVICVPDSPAEA